MNTIVQNKYITLILTIFLLSACGKEDPCDVYPNCNTTPPVWGDIEVDASITDEQPSVKLHFYVGKRGDSLLYDETTTSAYESFNLPVGRDITATATYYRGPDTIVAVDKARLTYNEETGCGHTCYTLKDAKFRLELK